MLFADDTGNSIPIWVAGILLPLGGGMQWFLNWLVSRSKLNRDEERKDAETALEQRDKIIARMDAERQELRKELHDLRDLTDSISQRQNVSSVRLERAIVWIKMHETALRAAGLPFEPFTDLPIPGAKS